MYTEIIVYFVSIKIPLGGGGWIQQATVLKVFSPKYLKKNLRTQL